MAETAADFPRFNARLLVRALGSARDALEIFRGVGSEVRRPLAAVVMGGIVTFSLLIPLVLPGLGCWRARTPLQPPVPSRTYEPGL